MFYKMKVIKYLTYVLALSLMFSCDKHEILFNTTDVDDTMAEFQLHYFEPINNEASYYIDSVFVNDVLYSSVHGSGQLVPYNGVPGGAVGRFFAVKAGDVNFKFYRGGDVVYNQTVALKSGKQNVFVHNMSKAPVVLDNQYPYNDLSAATGRLETWETDSIAGIKFFNFLYEDGITPYSGKLQYQYTDARTKEWKNLGEPVGFGEATDRVKFIIVKDDKNSAGSCRFNYRILNDKGEVLECTNGSGMVEFTYNFTPSIGRSYMHILGGTRTEYPIASMSVWTSL